LFHSLITATHEIGEIRIQFHTVTAADGHDQYESSLAAFSETISKYGQQPPTLLFTDNPKADRIFF